jgi:hypothetical protein
VFAKLAHHLFGLAQFEYLHLFFFFFKLLHHELGLGHHHKKLFRTHLTFRINDRVDRLACEYLLEGAPDLLLDVLFRLLNFNLDLICTLLL